MASKRVYIILATQDSSKYCSELTKLIITSTSALTLHLFRNITYLPTYHGLNELN